MSISNDIITLIVMTMKDIQKPPKQRTNDSIRLKWNIPESIADYTKTENHQNPLAFKRNQEEVKKKAECVHRREKKESHEMNEITAQKKRWNLCEEKTENFETQQLVKRVGEKPWNREYINSNRLEIYYIGEKTYNDNGNN